MTVHDNREMSTWSIDKKTNVLTMSKSLMKWEGYSRSSDEKTEMSNFLYEMVDVNDISLFNEHMAKLDSGEASSLEHRIVIAPNELRWVQSIGIPVRDHDDRVYRIEGMIIDITEKKAEQKRLEDSVSLYQKVIDTIDVAVWSFDTTTKKVLFVSEAIATITGYPIEKTIEYNFWVDVAHIDDKPYIEKIRAAAGRGNGDLSEHRIIHSSGDIRWLHVQIIPYVDESRSLTRLDGIVIDITARKQAEQEMLESEERYLQLQTSLDQFSQDLFGVMKFSHMEHRLLEEVQNLLQVTNIRLAEVEHNQDKLCQIIETEKGYTIKIGEIKGKSCLLCIDEKPITLSNTSTRVWLETLTRYVSVLYDNLLLIEDLTKELEQMASKQIAPTWLLRFMFKLSENERKLLAQDLHDSALQEQIIWYRKLDLLLHDQSINAKVREQLRPISEGLLDVIYQLRITCNELRPPMLIKDGLPSSLEALFNFTQLRSDYCIHFDAEHFNHKLSDDILIGLYRIVQELLANASKHSLATEVRISLSSTKEQIVLEYADNGIGIDFMRNEISLENMGIYGMKERVRSMEGMIELRSSVNKGLAVFISIPVQ